MRERVAAHVQRAATTLKREGETARAEELEKLLLGPARKRPAVFVAGEDKRGKSTLVNALLRQPGASPTGVEVVTGAPITFFHAQQQTAQAYRYGSPEATEMDPEEARALATVAGNPGNRHNIRSIAIGMPLPILTRLNLIDTPGVGGLTSGHGSLTLQSLASADALLFVIDAGAQFRNAELDFLREASARIDTVILVLTKIDLHRGWRRILQDNLAILQERAPRFARCPVVPVSALMAMRGLQAAADGDEEEAKALREESGMAQLEQAIVQNVVARSALLREANMVRAAHDALVGAERAFNERQGAAAPDPAQRQQLEAEKRKLQGLGGERAEWLSKLDAEVRRIQLERTEYASRATLDVRRRFDERLKRVTPQDMEVMPGELVAELSAIAGDLNDQAQQRLSALVAEVLTELDDRAGIMESIRTMTGNQLQEELEASPIGVHEITKSDAMSILSSFTSGRAIGSVAGVAAGALIAAPVGLALGFGVGGLFAFQAFRNRHQAAFTQTFQGWMQQQIQQTQLTINTSFQRSMIDVQHDIRMAIGGAIRRREQEITESLAAAQKMMEQDAQQRAQAQRDMQRKAQQLKDLRIETGKLLTSIQKTPAQQNRPAPAAQGGA